MKYYLYLFCDFGYIQKKAFRMGRLFLNQY